MIDVAEAAGGAGARGQPPARPPRHGRRAEIPVRADRHRRPRADDFDREVDAIRGLLGAKGVMGVDELRRGIEAIPEAEYHRLSYYQRWIRSITDNLLVRGVITAAELDGGIGDEVRARRRGPGAGRLAGGARPVHIRTPHYLRGRQGQVVRHLGDFPNPEDLAFARPAARLPLYHVAFTPDGIWPGGGRPTFSWRCSNHGCCRSEPAARRERPPAGGGARIAGRQGDRSPRTRSPTASGRPTRRALARAPAWLPAPGSMPATAR